MGTGANEPFEISQIVSQEKENMNKGVGKIEGEKTCALVEMGWFVSRGKVPRDGGQGSDGKPGERLREGGQRKARRGSRQPGSCSLWLSLGGEVRGDSCLSPDEPSFEVPTAVPPVAP